MERNGLGQERVDAYTRMSRCHPSPCALTFMTHMHVAVYVTKHQFVTPQAPPYMSKYMSSEDRRPPSLPRHSRPIMPSPQLTQAHDVQLQVRNHQVAQEVGVDQA